LGDSWRGDPKIDPTKIRGFLKYLQIERERISIERKEVQV
jgi:hypothetical protein